MSDHQTSPKNLQDEANILVVDDSHVSLCLLVSMLAEQGYKVQTASNGRIALAAAQTDPPDLILLDIMMPEMNGYQVCRRLKADERTSDIPVIFISAMNEVLDKVTAFSSGGVDYITKPFQVEEVLARVTTHLAPRRMQKHLREQIAELDAFAHTVAHDLQNPLGIIIGYVDYLVEVSSSIERDELLKRLHTIQRAGHKAVSIIHELMLLAGVRKADVQMTTLDMAIITMQVQQRLMLMIKKYQGELIIPTTWPVARSYAPWVEEVWTNYLSNGLKYGGEPPRLELGATPQADGMIRFWVRDNGPGLTPEAQATLFAEFSHLSEIRAEGHGLGLSIVRRIMDKLGGQVGVESEVGHGSLFYFTLPTG